MIYNGNGGNNSNCTLTYVLYGGNFAPAVFETDSNFSGSNLCCCGATVSLNTRRVPVSRTTTFAKFSVMISYLLKANFSNRLGNRVLRTIRRVGVAGTCIVDTSVGDKVGNSANIYDATMGSSLAISVNCFGANLFLGSTPCCVNSIAGYSVKVDLVRSRCGLVSCSLLRVFRNCNSLIVATRRFFRGCNCRPSGYGITHYIRRVDGGRHEAIMMGASRSTMVTSLGCVCFYTSCIVGG